MSSDRRGFALIIVLWALALLTTLVMSFALFTRQEAMGARNFKEETGAYYAALSGYEDAVKYLAGDKDLMVDTADENGNLLTDKERDGISGEKKEGNYDIKIRVTDEESRLNINTIKPEVFRRALEYAGIPDEELDEISDSVQDWKDADDAHHLMGAESDYYESLSLPYKAKNAPLDSVEELLLVKGMKREYLYPKKEGTEKNSLGLGQIFTVYGRGLNVNTAPKAVFEILGLDSPTIDKLIEDRKIVGGLRSVPPNFALAGINLVGSLHYRIEVWAGNAGGKEKVKITSVLEREGGPAGNKFKVIYWKEGIEYSGA